MSEALAHIQFDDPPRGSGGGDNATARIASTLASAGIDAPSTLYDEALALARDGHLGQAYARLQMLLCLDPDDAEALLLLAKVHAAQGRASEALARLDASVAAGALPPVGFREHLEAMLRAERSRDEENRARIAAREQGEIRQLRNEARTLRSDNVRLETEIAESALRERNWKYAALGASLFGTAVILLITALGHGSGTTAAAVAPEATAAVSAPPAAAPMLSHVESAPAAAPVAKPAAAAPNAAKPVANLPAVADAKPVAPKPVDAAKPTAKPGGTHVVEAGDTLYTLSAKYYGDASHWEKIRDANQGVLKGKIALSIGMKLKIPK